MIPLLIRFEYLAVYFLEGASSLLDLSADLSASTIAFGAGNHL